LGLRATDSSLWLRATKCSRRVKDTREGHRREVPLTVVVLLAGLAIAFLVFAISGGHVVFLPLILLFPLALFFGRRRRY
jgi:hypothetical protein